MLFSRRSEIGYAAEYIEEEETMAEFTTTNIRNIALMGHGSEGKTTLTEAMLFAAGMIDRQGKVEDGTTVSDFDPEEKKRGFSISASYAPIP